TKATDRQLALDAVATMHDGASRRWQRRAAALADTILGRVSDAAGGIGAEVRLLLGPAVGCGAKHVAAVHASDSTRQQRRTTRRTRGRRAIARSARRAGTANWRAGGVGPRRAHYEYLPAVRTANR